MTDRELIPADEPDAFDVTNEMRAGWAEQALEAFVRATNCEGGEEALADLLCDLMHWAGQNPDVDFDECMGRAERNYEAERFGGDSL